MPTPRIFQINLSGGGVPKLAVPRATVTEQGLDGDVQKDLRYHGGPKRALCLFSLERILALQEQGHPIFPGAAGENLTISGVDWAQVTPGCRLQLGGQVVAEVLSYTEPCSTIRQYFKDGKIQAILQDRNPGWSRVYARVLEPGEIGVGDEVKFL